MADTIEARIQDFREGHRDLARQELPDGSAKVLRAHVDGPRYAVLHVAGDEARDVFSTAFADEAAAAYGSFEPSDRAMHPAYLPRGVSWPAKGAITFAVFAAGTTVEDCLRGFLHRAGETLKAGSIVDMEPEAAKPHEWGVGFVSEESGTGFKAAGVNVPGGVLMTWWS